MYPWVTLILDQLSDWNKSQLILQRIAGVFRAAFGLNPHGAVRMLACLLFQIMAVLYRHNFVTSLTHFFGRLPSACRFYQQGSVESSAPLEKARKKANARGHGHCRPVRPKERRCHLIVWNIIRDIADNNAALRTIHGFAMVGGTWTQASTCRTSEAPMIAPTFLPKKNGLKETLMLLWRRNFCPHMWK